MRDYLRGVKNFPIRVMPVTVCTMILFACVSLYSANFSKGEMDQQVSTLTRENQELQWNLIEDSILDSYVLSKSQAKVLSLEVERELTNEYSDMGELKAEFETDRFSDKFSDILKGVLHKDGRDNGSVITLVGTRDNLITLFANTDNHILNNIDSDKSIPWHSISEGTPNPELTDKAIQAVIKKDPGVIFTQRSLLPNGDIGKPSFMNMDSLKDIYYDHGIEGLYSITLLAAAYITEDGDIFGTPDNTFLQNNPNHKLVIVKTLNVGDIITRNKQVSSNVLNTMDSITELTRSQGTMNVYHSIIWCAFSFIISLYLIFVYNNEERRGLLGNKREENDNEETENTTEGGNDKEDER